MGKVIQKKQQCRSHALCTVILHLLEPYTLPCRAEFCHGQYYFALLIIFLSQSDHSTERQCQLHRTAAKQ